jgi:hypothetical protein
MTPLRALITGAPDRVASLSKAFEHAGVQPLTLAELGPDTPAIDRYVQLGFAVPARGDTVVRRVHSFLNDGLLERFTIAERVLPMLAEKAIVLLVAGNVPVDGAAPDDRAARLLLLRVLAHAIRADQAPHRVRVRVISDERSDAQIVDFAVSGKRDVQSETSAQADRVILDRSYEDWRIEVMGLAQVEV